MLTVDKADAHIVENSADADVEVLRCEIRSRNMHAGAMTAAEVPDVCLALRSPFGGTISLGPDEQLVLQVTPHRAGLVRSEGVDLSYHRGHQHGTVHSGAVVELHAA